VTRALFAFAGAVAIADICLKTEPLTAHLLPVVLVSAIDAPEASR
jgi:hypothetical protein